MKLFAALAALAILAIPAFGQEMPKKEPTYMRIRVMSADPWFVKAMLEGVKVTTPELSTLMGFAGVPDQESALISGLLGAKGHIIVDPTDNSLVVVVKN